MSNPNSKPPRGSFPKGPDGETAEKRRERYELWVTSTHSRQPDLEAQSINFYRGRSKTVPTGLGAKGRKTIPATPSRKLCAASRCWQCEHGNDDPNGHVRIANCSVTKCGLWPVRPYQDLASDITRRTAGRQSYAAAIREHCMQCSGGKTSEVQLCESVTCALFKVRAGRRPSTDSGEQAAT